MAEWLNALDSIPSTAPCQKKIGKKFKNNDL